MNDRLLELKTLAANISKNKSHLSVSHQSKYDIRSNRTTSNKSNDSSRNYSETGSKREPLLQDHSEKSNYDLQGNELEQIETLKSLLSDIQLNNEELLDLCKKLRKSGSADNNNKIFKRLHRLRTKNNQNLDKIKNDLQSLKQSLIESTNIRDDDDFNLVKNSYDSILKEYERVLIDYRNLEYEFKEIESSKIKNTAKEILKNVGEEKIDELVTKDPKKLQTMMLQASQSTAGVLTVNTVKDIKEKYDEILYLQENVIYILKLIEDIQVLVFDQSEDLRALRTKVVEAKEKAQSGEIHLEKAKKYHKAGRKRECWICCCVSMTLIVICGPIILTILNNKGLL